MEMFPAAPGVMMNIDKARRIVLGRKPNGRLYVKRAAWHLKQGYASVNLRHAKRGKLKDEPVIMIVVAGVRVLIDGWHRAYRASKTKRRFLPAHVLTEREARSCGIPAEFTRPARKR